MPGLTMPKKHSRRGSALVVARSWSERTECGKVAQSVAEL